MFGRIHQWLPAVVGFAGVVTAWADTGYLPQGGPMALRFRVPPPPVADHPLAPPPQTPPPPAPIALPSPPMPSAPPQTTNVASAIMSKPATTTNALEFDAREPISDLGSAAAADGVISPQMLIKYFTAPSNSVPRTMVSPVGFTPPPVTPPAPTPPAAGNGKPANPP